MNRLTRRRRRKQRSALCCRIIIIVFASAYSIGLFYLQTQGNGHVIELELEGYQIRVGALFFGDEANEKKGIIPTTNTATNIDLNSTAERKKRVRKKQTHNPFRQHTCRIPDANSTFTFIAAPDFIIAGTQKSGTTAIRAWLNQHPNVVGSVNFEQHFFDHEYNRLLEEQAQSRTKTNYINLTRNRISSDNNDNEHDEQVHCSLLSSYIRNMQVMGRIQKRAADPNITGKIVSFEKTPSYLLWPHIPTAVKRTCPWMPLVIVALRNPIDRLYSQYRMEYSRAGGEYPSLEDVINSELDKLRQHGLSRAPPLVLATTATAATTGLFGIDHIDDALRDDKDSIFNPDLSIPSYKRYLQRGMYSVQLRRWYTQYDNEHNNGNNDNTTTSKLLVVSFEDLARDPQAVWNRLQDFVGVPRMHLTTEQLSLSHGPKQNHFGNNLNLTTTTVAVAPPMHPATRAYLQAFYQPYKEALIKILNRPLGEWD